MNNKKTKDIKNIFMVTYGGGHVNIIKALYKKLITQPDIKVTILALTVAPTVLKVEKIPYVTISQLVGELEYKDEVRRIGERLAKTNHTKDSGIAYEDSVAYLGIGYYDLVRECGEKKAEELFAENGRKVFLPIYSMTKLIKKIKPNAVVITSSPRMEKAAGIAAARCDIPVIKVNDLPIVDRLEDRCTVCVMNDWAKDYAINKAKISPENVVVTGQPVFEENLIIEEDIKAEYKNKIKNGYSKLVVYLGQTNNPDTQATVEQLYKFAKKNSNVLILIRPHPNDEIQYDGIPLDNFIITKEGILKYIISNSDVAITHYSTAGLEAALLEKPLITVLIDSIKGLRYSEYGIACEVNKIEDMDSCLKECLKDESIIKNRLNDGLRLFRNKENAADNIVQVIKDKINEKERF